MNQTIHNFTSSQWKVFSEDLMATFIRAGFDVVDRPYVDYSLSGFRATYVRRYNLQHPTPYYDGILTSYINIVGLPFGHRGQKMVILSSPRDTSNQPISDPVRLRVKFDESGSCQVVEGEVTQKPKSTENTPNKKENPNADTIRAANSGDSTLNNHTFEMDNPFSKLTDEQQNSRYSLRYNDPKLKYMRDLANYVANIIETISPGLIELPVDMKLEILKKLKVDSIIRMSQVNHEFRSLIFQHGEPLWRHLCLRDFNLRSINRNVHFSWMELYRDSYLLHQIEVCRKERALPGLPERPALPPAPYRLQIEWFPEVLELPMYPFPEPDIALPLGYHDEVDDQRMVLALEILPLRRVDSLDSLH